MAAALFASVGAVQAQPAPEVYAALPAMQGLTVSPDGASVAYIDRTGPTAQIVARSRAGEVIAQVDAGERLVRSVFWITSDHIGILQEATYANSGAALIDIVNIRTNRIVRAMDGVDNTYPMIGQYQPGMAGRTPVLYVTAWGAAPTRFGENLYRVDLDTGRGRLVQEGAENLSGYLLRPSGEIAGQVLYDSVDGRWQLSARTGSGWREIHAARALLDPPDLLGFGRTTDLVAFYDEVDGRHTIYQEGLLADQDVEPIILPSAPTDILRGPDRAIIAVGFNADGAQYAFLDPARQQTWNRVRGAFAGKAVSIESISDDLNVMSLYVEGGDEPGAYYLYDGAQGRLSLVRKVYPGVAADQVAPVRPVSYAAADGLTIEGYLTLPPGRDPRGLPLIVLPHGGPQASDVGGFDWEAQAYASRGYAVLQPNFRGSTGRGEEFVAAGYGQWGRKMQSDLSDGVRWLAGEGVIDPARVCIVGSSYGGYAALAGMTLDAGVYRCGVAVAGVADLRQFLRSEERLSERGERNASVRYWRRFLGVEGGNESGLDAISPALLAARANGPILLIHGRQDKVVPYEQSEIMHRALLAAGKQSKLVPLEREDHFLSWAPTRLQTLQASLNFLAEHNPAH